MKWIGGERWRDKEGEEEEEEEEEEQEEEEEEEEVLGQEDGAYDGVESSTLTVAVGLSEEREMCQGPAGGSQSGRWDQCKDAVRPTSANAQKAARCQGCWRPIGSALAFRCGCLNHAYAVR